MSVEIGGMLPPWTVEDEDHYQRLLAHLRECTVWDLDNTCPGLEALFAETDARYPDPTSHAPAAAAPAAQGGAP